MASIQESSWSRFPAMGDRHRGFVALAALFLAAACGNETGRPFLVDASATSMAISGSSVPVAMSAPVVVSSTTSALAPADDQPGGGLAIEMEQVLAGLEPLDGFGDGVLIVESQSQRTVHPVLIADSARERVRGLMGVLDLVGYVGMVFVWTEQVEVSFWMRDTPMPLSIAFIDSGGMLVSTADMEPCLDRTVTCQSYGAAGPYSTALEVPQGTLGDIGVETEATMVFVPR